MFYFYKQETLLIFVRFFPKIFGDDENLPLDKQGTLLTFEKLTDEVIHVFGFQAH